MAENFWDNPHFVQHERLLRQLHHLMASGRGDTDEAEAVRCDMDTSWRRLNREEIARLKGLSADLYMLEDDEVLEPARPNERSPDELKAELETSWRQGKWEDVLRLLRKGRSFGTQGQVAYLRARAYEQLGHLDASLLFMEYAASLKPDDATYDGAVMELLITLKRYDEAVALAELKIERSKHSPGLLIQAAGILLRAAKERPGEQNRAIYEHTIEVLNGALEASSKLLPVVVVFGYLTLGFCHQALEQWQLARGAYDRALQVSPDDPILLSARGLLLTRLDPQGAILDFTRAVDRGTVLAAPHLHLAHDALVRRDYVRCLELCIRILSLPQKPHPRLLATALQWLAIAQFELDGPPDVVRQNFVTALDLDPLNEQIRSNFERFNQLVQTGPTTHDRGANWPAIGDLDPALTPPFLPTAPNPPPVTLAA
jgi:tetratricopeptide (TPR) repeat protein